jgi:hypothetical protein
MLCDCGRGVGVYIYIRVERGWKVGRLEGVTAGGRGICRCGRWCERGWEVRDVGENWKVRRERVIDD